MMLLFVVFLVLVSFAPTKNNLKYYEIKGWGKFVCSTDYDWFSEIKNKECWLLTVEEEMDQFIVTYNEVRK